MQHVYGFRTCLFYCVHIFVSVLISDYPTLYKKKQLSIKSSVFKSNTLYHHLADLLNSLSAIWFGKCFYPRFIRPIINGLRVLWINYIPVIGIVINFLGTEKSTCNSSTDHSFPLSVLQSPFTINASKHLINDQSAIR